MAYYAGKTGFVSVTPSAGGAAVRFPLEEWSLELEVEEVDLTNFESYGMNSILGGIRGGTISASGQYESTAVSGGILTDFQSGKIVVCELGLLQTGTIGFSVSVLLTGVTVGMNVREKATFEFSGTLTNMDNTGAIVALQNQTIAQA